MRRVTKLPPKMEKEPHPGSIANFTVCRIEKSNRALFRRKGSVCVRVRVRVRVCGWGCVWGGGDIPVSGS